MIDRRRILVIDDDDGIRAFVTTALVEEGYDVAAAADGAAAFELLQQVAPSLILLDIRMPGMTGIEFAHAYQQLPEPRAPIVLLTASLDAADQAAQIAAAAFLAKPFDLVELLDIAQRLTLPPSDVVPRSLSCCPPTS